MNTIDFSAILFESAQLCGLDRANLQTQDFRTIRDLASGRLALAWHRHKWVDTRRVVAAVPGWRIVGIEKVFDFALNIYRVTAVVDRDVAYSTAGQTVTLNGVDGTGYDDHLNATHTIGTWQTGTASAGGQVVFDIEYASGRWDISSNATWTYSPTEVESWALVDGDEGKDIYVDVDTIDQVMGVYEENPLTTKKAPMLSYSLEGQLIHMADAPTEPVYVEYNATVPALYGEAYVANTAYYVGAQVYYDTSSSSGSLTPTATKQPKGNFYRCIAQTDGSQAPTNTSYWELVEIPKAFARYLPRAILADYLRSEQQFEPAQQAEADAEAFLELEAHKLYTMQRQSPRIEINTY